jgi:hypothetical protein
VAVAVAQTMAQLFADSAVQAAVEMVESVAVLLQLQVQQIQVGAVAVLVLPQQATAAQAL